MPHYYAEDAIEQVKKMRQAIKDCQKLCSEDINATPLQKKIVHTLDLLLEPIEVMLNIEFRFDDFDLD